MAQNHSQGKKHDVKKIRAHVERLQREARADKLNPNPEEVKTAQNGIGAYGAFIVNPKASAINLEEELGLVLSHLEVLAATQVAGALHEFNQNMVDGYMNCMERLVQQCRALNAAIFEKGVNRG